jgi:hypothetical protein
VQLGLARPLDEHGPDIDPVVVRHRGKVSRINLRADAAFAIRLPVEEC